jgi:hypothetical protein
MWMIYGLVCVCFHRGWEKVVGNAVEMTFPPVLLMNDGMEVRISLVVCLIGLYSLLSAPLLTPPAHDMAL